MYIYNQDRIFSYSILDSYILHYTSFDERTIQLFFNKIKMTRDITSLTSLYIQYQTPPFLFENNPKIYSHLHPYIQKLIIKFFDYEHSYMIDDTTHTFFLIILNTNHEEIIQSFLSLQKYLSQKHFSYKHQNTYIDIRCGIYKSHPFTHPFQIYLGAKKQFENTLQHNYSLLAVKP